MVLVDEVEEEEDEEDCEGGDGYVVGEVFVFVLIRMGREGGGRIMDYGIGSRRVCWMLIKVVNMLMMV